MELQWHEATLARWTDLPARTTSTSVQTGNTAQKLVPNLYASLDSSKSQRSISLFPALRRIRWYEALAPRCL